MRASDRLRRKPPSLAAHTHTHTPGESASVCGVCEHGWWRTHREEGEKEGWLKGRSCFVDCCCPSLGLLTEMADGSVLVAVCVTQPRGRKEPRYHPLKRTARSVERTVRSNGVERSSTSTLSAPYFRTSDIFLFPLARICLPSLVITFSLIL